MTTRFDGWAKIEDEYYGWLPVRSQLERMAKNLPMAEFAAKDERLTPETREKARKAAERARAVLSKIAPDLLT